MFREQLADSPFGFVAICCVFIPVTIWVFSFMSWTIMGDVEWEWGILGMLGGAGMGLATIYVPDPNYAPLLLLATVGMMVAFPLLRNHMIKRASTELDIERLERAYETARLNPKNESAKLRVAEVLYSRGYVPEACALYEAGLTGLPPHMFASEYQMLRQWQAQIGGRTASQVRCPHCRAFTAPNELFCGRCGASVYELYAKSSWLGPNIAKRVIAAWVAGVLALIGIPFTVQLADSYPFLAVFLILMEVAAAAAIIVFAFVQTARGQRA